MKKVLYVATVLSHICQFHLPYLKVFKEKGFQVHVAARNNLAEKNGLKLEYADKTFEVPFCRSPFDGKNISAYKRLKDILNAEHYDIIICNTPVGGVVTRLAARKTRKKGSKVVYIAHGFHFYKGAPLKNWIAYYPVEKYLSKKTDILLTITKEDYQLALKKFKTDVRYIHGLGVNDNRHYPVNMEEKYCLRKELNVKDDDFIGLCTGELNQNKNQKILIELVPELIKEIPSFKLWLAGNGPTKDVLEKRIKELGVEDNVKLLGYQPNIEKYVRMCDIVLTASKREGLPFNVVEAMLTKRPVVASVNRGHKELIKDRETGFLISDEKEFKERIIELHQNTILREQICENAYQFIKEYALSSTVKELFEEILNI